MNLLRGYPAGHFRRLGADVLVDWIIGPIFVCWILVPIWCLCTVVGFVRHFFRWSRRMFEHA